MRNKNNILILLGLRMFSVYNAIKIELPDIVCFSVIMKYFSITLGKIQSQLHPILSVNHLKKGRKHQETIYILLKQPFFMLAQIWHLKSIPILHQ